MTSESGHAPPAGQGTVKAIKMAPKIAYRNLFHDRMSLFVTLVGIVFSVVLVAIQCGLYLGSESKIATVLDKAYADLWIVPHRHQELRRSLAHDGPREVRGAVDTRRAERRGDGRELRVLA